MPLKKGCIHSDESNRRRSETMKKHCADPLYIKRMSENAKKNWEDPEYIAKHSGDNNAMHANQSTRDKISGENSAMLRPEVRKIFSDLGKTRKGEKSFAYGKHPTKEQRKLQSDRMSGTGNPFYGKHHTDEVKEFIRANTSNHRTYNAKNNTSIEIELQVELAWRNISFETEKPIGGYTRADIFIEPNIVVYADGDYWHNIPERIEKDKMINDKLLKAGYKVYRFWEHEIKEDISACVNRIKLNKK